MVALAASAREKPDTKAELLLAWIRERLCPEGKWNDDRLLVFTEYRDTLDYLVRVLKAAGLGDRVLTLHGGAGQDRERIKKAFRAVPSEEPMRILVATDAASEGLNLQDHCRYLIHWEIPWNPNKMEQRNGRIDRHGQKADEVFCWHFAFEGWEDQHFLDVVVDKVRTQRADLGSVGDVIAAQVEKALRGERKEISTPEQRRQVVHDDVRAEVMTKERIRELQAELAEAREAWSIYPETLRLVLDEALRLAGHRGLEPVEAGDLAGRAWLLKNLPAAWSECAQFIKDAKGRLLNLVFDEEDGRDRRDVSLVHLDHPLVKRALAVFRQNLWSEKVHDSQRMSRVSYRVVRGRDLSRPAVVLVSRLIAVSEQGQKLHEELVLTGGSFQETEIDLDTGERLDRMLALDGEHPPLPVEVAGTLRRLFKSHEQQLIAALEGRVDVAEKDLKKRLKQRGLDEAREIRALVDERRKEIDKRVVEMEGYQTTFFDKLEGEQYDHDLKWLEQRRDQLAKERESEPEAIKARYKMRGEPRAFPLAVLYLLPDGLVNGGWS